MHKLRNFPYNELPAEIRASILTFWVQMLLEQDNRATGDGANYLSMDRYQTVHLHTSKDSVTSSDARDTGTCALIRLPPPRRFYRLFVSKDIVLEVLPQYAALHRLKILNMDYIDSACLACDSKSTDFIDASFEQLVRSTTMIVVDEYFATPPPDNTVVLSKLMPNLRDIRVE